MAEDDLGLVPAEPLGPSERVELEFLRFESAHLQRRLDEVEDQLADASTERDTIRHERNLIWQDLHWTLERLASSPLGPMLKRNEGFARLRERWKTPPS